MKQQLGRRGLGVAMVGASLFLIVAMLGAKLKWFEAFPLLKGYKERWEAQATGEVVWLKTYEEAVQLAKSQSKPI